MAERKAIELNTDHELAVIEKLRMELSRKLPMNDFVPLSVQRFVLYVLGFSVLVFMGSVFFERTQTLAFWTLVFISLCVSVMLVVTFVHSFIKLLQPDKALLGPSFLRLKMHDELVQWLDGYENIVLSRCKAHLEYEISGAVFRG